MKNILCISFLSLFVVVGNASAIDSSTVILKIAGEDVTKGEFRRVFEKNNNNDTGQQAINDYLELYINFKLKVKEAEEMQLDSSKAFKKELLGYRRQLAATYLTDKELEDHFLKEAYEMYSTELNTSQLFLPLRKKASPSDTLKLYNKISAIYKEYQNGKSFDDLIMENTDNEDIKRVKGNIGFRSAYSLLYTYSKAVLHAADGEVVKPIRTKYGYHLIRLEGRREALGKIKVAHILIKADKTGSEALAKEKILKIHAEIALGGNFAEIAKEKSHDVRSGEKGGVLKEFGAGKMLKEFEDAAFGLVKDGDVSKPIKTDLGWHLIKRIEKKEVESYENVKHRLKKKILSDNRIKIIRRSYVRSLMKKYEFSDNVKMRNQFYKVLDESYRSRSWEVSKAKGLTGVLFKLKGHKYTQQDFANYIFKHQRRSKVFSPIETVNSLYNSFIKESCMTIANKNLAIEYPDFKNLMKEYRDGILLFELTDNKVWTKAVKDSLGLKTYYDNNKGQYLKGKSAKALVVTCASQSIAKQSKKAIKKKSMEEAYKILMKIEEGISVDKGSYSAKEDVMKNSEWKVGIGANSMVNDSTQFVIIYSLNKERQKTLAEARGLVTADYQDFLEEQWIEALRKKYEVVIEEDVLLSISK
ncbi:MAG: peptidylprolyl isomerase [Flavobacteriales bacterium]|nr:peptidylprolyl isomerase [Flavobacteriales bacterium]